MMVHGGSSPHEPISESPTTTTSTTSNCNSWTLYDNPFYSWKQKAHKLHKTASLLEKFSPFNNTAPAMERDSEDQLEMARTQILELRSELEYERGARKKVEMLNKRLAKELAEERKGREALERDYEDLAKEIKSCKSEIEKMKRDIEEERKMLRTAEFFREERVQMKLAEAKILFDQRLLELEGTKQPERESSIPRKIVEERNRDASLKIATDLSGKFSKLNLGKRCCDDDEDNDINYLRRSSRYQPTLRMVLSENVSSIASSKRKASPEPENPHIKRGIKGFVEFPRVVRAIGAKNRHWSTKLEQCQKSQLRILLKQKCPIRSDINLILG